MAGPSLRVVILDAATFGDASLQPFTSRWDCAIHDLTRAEQAAQRLQGFPVAVVNKVVLNRSLLDSPEASDLKLVAVAATGTDNVDLEAAKARGIRVCNVPGYAAPSVAQFTMALILELATRAGKYAELVRQGTWQKSPIYTVLEYPISELYGKKLGIIGYGSIGRAVAKIAQGFGMEILISARAGLSGPAPQGRVPLDNLLATADIITLHCPLTPETRNLIDRRALSLLKPTAFLVNTARGALVDEAALVQALREKRIAGAALDVISKEPPPEDHPILKAAGELDNLLVTPHCAWSAREARARLLAEVAENILAFTEGRERNVVA